MTLARDALDRQLIALLQMNARMPTAEIARRLGLAAKGQREGCRAAPDQPEH